MVIIVEVICPRLRSHHLGAQFSVDLVSMACIGYLGVFRIKRVGKRVIICDDTHCVVIIRSS